MFFIFDKKQPNLIHPKSCFTPKSRTDNKNIIIFFINILLIANKLTIVNKNELQKCFVESIKNILLHPLWDTK